MHMPILKKFSNMKSAFTKPSRRNNNNSKEQESSSLGSKSSSVSHEYIAAFRTKSYVEIYDKVQEIVGGDNNNNNSPSTSSSSPLLNRRHESLSGYLLELCQETMAKLPQQASNAHPLLNEYFLVSLEACMICESLLKIVLQTRTNYKNIKKIKKFPRNEVWSEEQVDLIYGEIASFSMLRNPLSGVTRVWFDEVQDGHFGLLDRLTSKRRRIKRRMKLLRFFKKALGFTFVVGYTAFAIAFVILTVHFAVCALAGPGLVALSLGVYRRLRGAGREMRESSFGGLYAQLDAAAKGVYIMINDFGTVSRLVGRLNDEMEHNKTIADMCARKHNDDMLKEVVRDFAIHEGWFLGQLKELEQHIYLCFLNIIRSRRMVVQEIMECESKINN